MASGKKKKGDRDERFRDIARNRRALYEYEIVERVDAGLVLIGTEVKGLRERGAPIGDAQVITGGGKAGVGGPPPPSNSTPTHGSHEPQRTRKLLLHRREIDRL